MTVTVSTRNRRNRVKGATGERDLARWLRPWYPDACRAIRNTRPDPGDIDCTSPGLFWSMKACATEQINAWMSELEEKRGDRLGLLIVRRKGHASPGDWWAWLTLRDLRALFGFDDTGLTEAWGTSLNERVRLELRALMPLLVQANYAPTPKVVA